MSETQDTSAEELFLGTRTMRKQLALHKGEMCPFCENPITPEQLDDPDSIYVEVISWVTGPKLQSPVLREKSGRIAHADCIRKLIDGQAADQDRLPGLE